MLIDKVLLEKSNFRWKISICVWKITKSLLFFTTLSHLTVSLEENDESVWVCLSNDTVYWVYIIKEKNKFLHVAYLHHFFLPSFQRKNKKPKENNLSVISTVLLFAPLLNICTKLYQFLSLMSVMSTVALCQIDESVRGPTPFSRWGQFFIAHRAYIR
jgi:hypothetical protein